MNKLKRLTEEIRSLSSGELAVLRAWFEDFDGIDSRRRIDAYLRAESTPDAGAAKPDENQDVAGDQTVMIEMAAGIREAYRQVAFQEYAQLVASDLGLSAMIGTPRG